MRRTVVSGDLDLLALHERWPRRYPFLLESVAGHPQSGRWDILFGDPAAALFGDREGLHGPGVSDGVDFFAALDRWVAAEGPPCQPADLPFCGGWFLLLGYEAARWVEPSLRLPAAPAGLPDALAVRCTSAVIRDRRNGEIHLLAERGEAQLARLNADVDACLHAPAPAESDWKADVVEEPADRFVDGVARILDWLRAGDAFQVNLSRAWDARIPQTVSAADLYRRLRRSNPAPFAGLACWGDAAVVSSSPERLLQIDDGSVQTRPIAGTRRRGSDAAEDRALREMLIASLKERAEHVMLIDLERNDLGRVCVPGSVEVSELMAVESYAHVHHIVSNVRGRLRPGVGPGQALRAVFPGGTITGCPKVRVMQIIARLEGEGRGPYTGSMGYLSRDGRLDSNILIRSMAWRPGSVRFRAGAGIVADSVAQAELEETRTKARGLLRALGHPG